MTEVCNRAVNEHVDAIAFGDLFLPDIRAYRETQLKPTGLVPLFPLWELPTAALARDMIAGGLRAKLACVASKQLSESFAGREPPCLVICHQRLTRAENAASFIRAFMTGRCSRTRSRCRLERSSTGTGSFTQISNSKGETRTRHVQLDASRFLRARQPDERLIPQSVHRGMGGNRSTPPTKRYGLDRNRCIPA
jgi:hypothetical protein